MIDKNQRDGVDAEGLLMYANNIIATLREPFLILDSKLQIISTNQAFCDTFKVTEKETIRRPLPDVGNGQWNVPKLLELLKEILPEKIVVTDYEIEHKFENIGERVMSLNARQLRVPKKIAIIIAGGVKEEELILLAIEDITERKRLQVELKDSEERYRRAFETSRDGLLLIHKTAGDILNSNESAQKLLGYSSDEFLKKKLWEIGVIKDRKDFQGMMSTLERDGVIHYEGVQVKTSKGPKINSDVFLVDKAKVVQCNIRDITEREWAEEVIKETAQEWSRTFNAIADLIFILDKNFTITGANKAFCDALKLKPEDVVGKKCYELLHNRNAPWPACPFEKTICDGKPHTGEVDDPNIGMPLLVTVSPFLDENGRVIGSAHYAKDITELKKSEEEKAKHIKELEVFYEASVGREERILELKKEIERLKKELNEKK